MSKTFARKAPPGMFRVHGLDLTDGSDWMVGDFENPDQVRVLAKQRSDTYIKIFVHDDQGNLIFESGGA